MPCTLATPHHTTSLDPPRHGQPQHVPQWPHPAPPHPSCYTCNGMVWWGVGSLTSSSLARSGTGRTEATGCSKLPHAVGKVCMINVIGCVSVCVRVWSFEACEWVGCCLLTTSDWSFFLFLGCRGSWWFRGPLVIPGMWVTMTLNIKNDKHRYWIVEPLL